MPALGRTPAKNLRHSVLPVLRSTRTKAALPPAFFCWAAVMEEVFRRRSRLSGRMPTVS